VFQESPSRPPLRAHESDWLQAPGATQALAADSQSPDPESI